MLLALCLPFESLAQRTKGYTGLVKLGIMNDMNPNDLGFVDFFPTLQTLHGYRFNPHFALLGGIELSAYESFGVLPVLVSAKGNLKKTGTTPFVSVELGYGLELVNDSNEYTNFLYNPPRKTLGGITFGSEVGLEFPIRRKTAITMSIGYRAQKWGYNEYSAGINRLPTLKFRENVQNLHMRIGISF